MRQIIFVTSAGKSLTQGAIPSDSESSELTFSTDQFTVGLHGVEGASSRFFQVIAPIIVDPACYKGQEIVNDKPNSDDMAEADQQTMIIIIVVCAVVGLLILGGIIAFCLYKKNKMSGDQTGIEVVAVTKTRPVTPPVHGGREPAAQNNTEEEDLGGAAGNVDKLNSQKSRSDKPDIIV